MRWFLKISVLLISITLHAQNGGIYELNNGRKGVKLFGSGDFNGKWSDIISLNLNNDGLTDLLLINQDKTSFKLLLVKDRIVDFNSEFPIPENWNLVVPVDLNGDNISEIVFIDSSGVNSRLCSFDASQNKFICDTLKVNSDIKDLTGAVTITTDISQREKLFLYSSISGKAGIFAVNQNSELIMISDAFTMQKGFDKLLTTNVDGNRISELILFNSKKQYYKLITTEDNKLKTIVDSVNTEVKWSRIINGNFGSGRSLGDFIFTEKKSGSHYIFKLDFNGYFVPFRNKKCNLGTNWNILVPGKFSYNYTDGILLYKN